MGSLNQKLRKIDSFGRDLKFEEDGIQSFKTEVGATFTLIMFMIVIILAILFGQEIYQRKLPLVLVSNEIVEKGRIDLSEFPIILFFADIDGKNFDNAHDYVKVEVDYLKFSAENAISSTRHIGMFPCNPNDYANHTREFVKQYIENAKMPNGLTPYCINHNKTNTIESKFATANSSSLMISVHNCHEGNCPEDQYYKNRIFFIAVSYYNSFFNPKSYDDPVSYYSEVYTKQVGTGTGMLYDTYFKLSNDEFLSDNGWILENNQKLNAIKVESLKEEVYQRYHERLIRLIFEVSKKKELVSRSYMKVQELFAKIGGVFNACSILFNLILYDYILFRFRLNYLNPAMGLVKQINFSNKEIQSNNNAFSDSSQPNEKILNSKYKSIPNRENFNVNNNSKDLDDSQSKFNAVNSKVELNIKKPFVSDNNNSGLKDPDKNDKNDEVKNAKFSENNAPRPKFNNNFVIDKVVTSKFLDNKIKSSGYFYDDEIINHIKNLSYLEVLYSRLCCCSKNNALVVKIESKEMLKKFALTEYLILLNKVEIVSESLSSKIF